MNMHSLRTILISALLTICSMGAAHAQNTVTVNGSSCPTATVTFGTGTIAISAPSGCVGVSVTPPTINASTPPAGNTGALYTHGFTAGGATPISWSVSSGTLPGGLTLAPATGVLSGTPSAAGTFPFSVTASNAGGSSAALPVSVTISPPSGPPVIQNTATSTATVGVAYSFQYSATGAQPITYTVTNGTLPTGITFTSQGLLSGTPTQGGSYPFTVTAVNGTTPNATQLVTLVVSTPVAPAITAATPPGGAASASYTYSFQATGTQPITWTVASGSLPPGLTLSTGGVLSGTPTTGGTYNFTVQAANGTTPNAVSGQISVTITAPTLPIPPTQDINNTAIPSPVSKAAKQPGNSHAAPSGGGNYPFGEIRGWGISPAYCGNTQPPITSVWYHNIDFADYGGQTTIDYIDMVPNQALVYGFVPGAAPLGYGNIYITTGPIGSPATTFVSISTTPCDFDVTKIANTTACYTSVSGENGFTYEITNAATSSVCKLTPGVQYFLNLRFQDARPAPVGTPTADSCAGQGSSVCGALLKIKKY